MEINDLLEEKCENCDGYGYDSYIGDDCKSCVNGKTPTKLGIILLEFLEKYKGAKLGNSSLNAR